MSVGMEARFSLLILGVDIHSYTLGWVTSTLRLCWVIVHRAELLLRGLVYQHLTQCLRDNTEALSVQRGLL